MSISDNLNEMTHDYLVLAVEEIGRISRSVSAISLKYCIDEYFTLGKALISQSPHMHRKLLKSTPILLRCDPSPHSPSLPS